MLTCTTLWRWWDLEADRIEKEAAALHLEVAALRLENWASRIWEEEAMVDLLVDCQEKEVAVTFQEEVAVDDQIQIQCRHLDRQ